MLFLELDEKTVHRLPYYGPMSRRIYILTEKDELNPSRELFIQRNDAFTTGLVGLLTSLSNREIVEIRYSTGFDGFVRIFLDDEGKLVGEFTCKADRTLSDFKKKLSL